MALLTYRCNALKPAARAKQSNAGKTAVTCMSSALKHVYCFRMASDDCYRTGLTKHLPQKRMGQFKTGSPVKFTACRDELTAHHNALETYIHNILADKRAENGKFFSVTRK